MRGAFGKRHGVCARVGRFFFQSVVRTTTATMFRRPAVVLSLISSQTVKRSLLAVSENLLRLTELSLKLKLENRIMPDRVNAKLEFRLVCYFEILLVFGFCQHFMLHRVHLVSILKTTLDWWLMLYYFVMDDLKKKISLFFFFWGKKEDISIIYLGLISYSIV